MTPEELAVPDPINEELNAIMRDFIACLERAFPEVLYDPKLRER